MYSVVVMSDTIIVTGNQIPLFRLITLKQALKLETLGMLKHGRSAYSIVKEEFGLTGSKVNVYIAFCKIVDEAKARSLQGIQ